jgi:electron transport complex protein RnfC
VSLWQRLANPFRSSKRFGFSGGITPPPRKARSLRSVIMDTPLPPRLIIPLQQHQGEAGRLCVAVGERVRKGQPLTRADGVHQLPVHAPAEGFISAIESRPVAAEFPRQELCIVIDTEGSEDPPLSATMPDWQTLTPAQIIAAIEYAGIAGLGGAGFPAAAKLRSASGRPVRTLIINAVECEPYITADQALLRERAAQVLTGAAILQRASAAQRTVIATDNDKTDAIAALRKAMVGQGQELVLLPPRYPGGSERQLIEQLTGQQVPEHGLPADLGVLMINAGTAYAVYRALVLGEPLISRIVTVCGDTLQTPKNFEVPLGTPIAHLFELCGVDYQRLQRVVMGGNMMGITLSDLSVPVTKTCNCLVAGSAEEFTPVSEPLACIRCGHCASACPAGLQPQQLHLLARNGDLERARDFGLQACIECGVCNWVCPSHIPLVQYFRAAKADLAMEDQQRRLSQHWQQRYEFHQYRIARSEKRRLANRARVQTPSPAEQTIDKPPVPIALASPASFDRNQARLDIEAALRRVQARRQSIIASTAAPHDSGEETPS